jgi:hypothetical protein
MAKVTVGHKKVMDVKVGDVLFAIDGKRVKVTDVGPGWRPGTRFIECGDIWSSMPDDVEVEVVVRERAA